MRASSMTHWARRSAVHGLILLSLGLAEARPATTAAAAATTPARRITIEGLSEPLSNLRLSDFNGRDLGGELKPQSERGHVTVALTHAGQFVVKPKTVASLSARAGEKLTLPGGVVVPLVAQAEGGAPAKSAWFRLTFAASPIPAPWDDASAGYVTRVTFGLKRPPQIPETIGLERPVMVKLGFEGLTAEEVAPFAIEAAGLEHEKTVELHFQPRTSKPTLLVRSTISDVNLELTALARLNVRPEQHEILGYGLEEVTVVIESVQADGEARPFEHGTPVAVEIDGAARAAADALAFPAGGSSVSLRVRSDGLGLATITASADGLAGRATVRQLFPLGQLVAAFLGAALGGYARGFVKGARRSYTKRRIVEGIVVGLVAFVAGVLGVGYLRLPPALVATEAGAFLVCALAGFAGVAVLETLAARKTAAD